MSNSSNHVWFVVYEYRIWGNGVPLFSFNHHKHEGKTEYFKTTDRIFASWYLEWLIEHSVRRDQYLCWTSFTIRPRIPGTS